MKQVYGESQLLDQNHMIYWSNDYFSFIKIYPISNCLSILESCIMGGKKLESNMVQTSKDTMVILYLSIVLLKYSKHQGGVSSKIRGVGYPWAIKSDHIMSIVYILNLTMRKRHELIHNANC